MESNVINNTLKSLEDMGNSILILYNAHAKGDKELTELANMTGYLLWNYTKSLITLNHFQNATLRCEQDFAIGELCITINECTKKIIGFKTKDGKVRKDSLWIDKMGSYISSHPELSNEYSSLKDWWISYADTVEIQGIVKDIRDIATHGDEKQEKLILLHNTSTSNVINYLDKWGKIMWSTANFVFTCFENECQQVMNNKIRSNTI